MFAAVKTDVSQGNEAELQYYSYPGELSETDYNDLENWLISNSAYNTDIYPAYGEQILILSTCSYHTENDKFIVAARRIS